MDKNKDKDKDKSIKTVTIRGRKETEYPIQSNTKILTGTQNNSVEIDTRPSFSNSNIRNRNLISTSTRDKKKHANHPYSSIPFEEGNIREKDTKKERKRNERQQEQLLPFSHDIWTMFFYSFVSLFFYCIE
jgi:hypothetical protein